MTKDQAGHGRVFIGLDKDQVDAFRQHLRERSIETTVVEWGAPTLVIRDMDENEIFIWLPENERAALTAESARAYSDAEPGCLPQ